jgi:osmoprotectant transport system permease protein
MGQAGGRPMSLLGDTWSFYEHNRGFVDGAIRTHVVLSATALGIAAGIGIALGVACAKLGRAASFVVVTIANLGRTVPTFAIIALAVALSSLGQGPAVVGLVALGVPPILLNAFTGVRSVDPGTLEASRGMGLSAGQLLLRVELPIATPLIFAGIRTSAVQIVATATLAGLFAAGGLGDVVLAGLNNNQDDVMLAGAIPVALLALLAEGLFAAVERLATPAGLRLARRRSTQGGIS